MVVKPKYKIEVTRTVNLKDYNSVKLGITHEFNGDKPYDEAFRELETIIDNRITKKWSVAPEDTVTETTTQPVTKKTKPGKRTYKIGHHFDKECNYKGQGCGETIRMKLIAEGKWESQNMDGTPHRCQ